MKKCILHVGMHKTGTSSIQRFLYENRRALDESGYYVPAAGMISPEYPAHHNLAWELSGDGRFNAAFGTCGELYDELEKSAGNKVVIVSSEDFVTLSRDVVKLKDFSGHLYSMGYTVEIILYVRARIDCAVSLFKELKRNKTHFLPGEELRAAEYADSLVDKAAYSIGGWYFDFDYKRLVENLKSAVEGVGHVSVRSYDQTRDVVSDFMGRVGMESAGDAAKPRENESSADGSDELEIRARLEAIWQNESMLQFAIEHAKGISVYEIYYRPHDGDDWEACNQIFNNKELDLAKTTIWQSIKSKYDALVNAGEALLVIDCGAHIGLSSIWFSAMFPDARIIALEPNHGNYKLASMNTQGIAQIEVIEKAIDSTAKHKSLLNAISSGSMSYVVTDEVVENAVQVEAVGMADLLTIYEGFTPFLVKVDIEGGEKTLFLSDCKWMRDVVLVVELHDWLFPEQDVSKNFWARVQEAPFDIDAIGEHLVLVPLQDDAAAFDQWKKTAHMLQEIYGSNRKLFGWRLQLERGLADHGALDNYSELGALRKENRRFTEELAAIRGSRSWQLTAPLRYAASLIRRYRKKAYH